MVAFITFALVSVDVATTISCCDLTVFPFSGFCVATSFLCRDTIFVVSHFDPLSQLPFHVARSYLVFCSHASCDFNYWPVCFLVATWKLGRDKVVSLLHAIPVATSKECRNRSFFQSCRNLIFDSQQLPMNSFSFSGRDLEIVSRLSSCHIPLL